MVTATSFCSAEEVDWTSRFDFLKPGGQKNKSGFWHDGSSGSLFFFEEEFFGDLESEVEGFFSDPFDAGCRIHFRLPFVRTGPLIVGFIKAGALENQAGSQVP